MSASTTYYVRAYATNSAGTAYGGEKSFSTLAPVAAGTYYVNIATGGDSSNGTSANPWKTLHYAVDQINGGSAGTYTLHVALGTYNTTNGEADKGLIISQSNVTVEGASGSGPIIDGGSASYWDYGIKITGSSVTLRNLYITGFTGLNATGIEIIAGSNNTIENCRVYGNFDGISVSESSNCTIQGCEIDNNNFDGISFSESTGGIITRNTIYDNFEADNSDGIIVQDCNPEISRNTIYDNRFNISLQADSGDITSPTIKNNLIYQVTSGEVTYGILMGGAGTASPKIYHNTIDGGSEDGINIDGTGNAPDIKYNIITGFGDHAVYNQNGNPVIDYNDAWNNTGGTYFGCVSPVPGENNISADPQYATSYTLAVTSPCINTIPTGNPPNDPIPVDFIGDTRPYGSGFDMGCYENDNLPAVTTTTASSISSTTASSGGNVTSGGSSSVTARGVCWSTSANPTISDSKTTDGSGTGSYTSSITGLSTSITYHIRAYATNTAGTAYGSDKTFTTSGPLSAGTYYVDVQNGNDSNDGSQANPWKTLHHAISEINNAATGTYILIMAAGTYKTGNGEADTAITLSQNDVTIIGAGDASIGASDITVVIDGTGAEGWSKGIEITGSNVIIRGLSITNFSEGIEISAGTENVVRHCKINNNSTGIIIGADASNYKVRSCEIYDNTDGLTTSGFGDESEILNTIYRNTGDGVAAYNCSPAIKRNKLYDCGTGIRIEASTSNTASPDIVNNVIYQETLAYVMNYGILVKGTGGVAKPTIYHNSIDAIGSGDGVAVEWTSTSNLEPAIRYNIITRCHAYGIDAAAGITCNVDYNDVWSNGETTYHGCAVGDNDISLDPKNGSSGPLASNSPCINAIPTGNSPNDPVTIDYMGYSRPKSVDDVTGFDMGAYEYIATQTSPETLPGGAGLETEYLIFTIPLNIGTGLDMRNTMEGTLGSYDPTHWRVFTRTTSGDIEMNTQAFESLDIKPGMGFWLLTLYTNTINFTGTLASDGIYYKIELAPGWNLFAVPWLSTSINLGKIYVTDGVNEYTITGQPDDNRLTQEYIWDYTGTGSTGYTVRSTSDFLLVAGTGYFVKVLGSSNITLAIPPNNSSDPPYINSAFASPVMTYGIPESVGLADDPEPPPLPGGSYGPVPDIRANGKSGLVTVPNGNPVSITVSLDPGDQVHKDADWWIVAHTPFAWPLDWYSYVYPDGWRYGIYPCVQTPLFQVPQSFEVLNTILPTGDYKFYFAVDENADGIVDETWVDSVEVRVE